MSGWRIGQSTTRGGRISRERGQGASKAGGAIDSILKKRKNEIKQTNPSIMPLLSFRFNTHIHTYQHTPNQPTTNSLLLLAAAAAAAKDAAVQEEGQGVRDAQPKEAGEGLG
jgi:hypothetical protein